MLGKCDKTKKFYHHHFWVPLFFQELLLIQKRGEFNKTNDGANNLKDFNSNENKEFRNFIYLNSFRYMCFVFS